METYIVYYHSPIGIIKIVAKAKLICSIDFVEKMEEAETKKTRVLKKCLKQLNEYFIGKRSGFSFAYLCEGSDFQQRVWDELKETPYGTTASYKDIAIRLGNPKLIRAVGNANGKNPIAIIIPCHRVIGSNGKLVGYAGGLWRKQWLLEHEQKHSNGKKQYTLFE